MPDDASNMEWAILEVVAGVIGALAGFGFILMASLAITPFRQRNEARQKLNDLEAEPRQTKLFDVFSPTTFVGLPLNRLDDGSFRASDMGVGFRSPILAYRGEDPINAIRLTASVRVWFANPDGQSWETTEAIKVAPAQNLMAGPAAMDFKWDISDPIQWVLTGLPLTMARDEVLQLPMLMITVADGDEVGKHFEQGETCSLVFKLAIRTDKGAPPISDQVISLERNDIRDTQWFKDISAQGTADESQ